MSLAEAARLSRQPDRFFPTAQETDRAVAFMRARLDRGGECPSGKRCNFSKRASRRRFRAAGVGY